MLVALTHGYIGDHPLGGEVSLHRTLVAAQRPTLVLTRTPNPYTVDGVRVEQIATTDVLNVNADPEPIAEQLRQAGATAVMAQNELSMPAVLAARMLGIPSIVSVHAPPKYGRNIAAAVSAATHRVYNTNTAMTEWRQPGIVLHPPTPTPTTIRHPKPAGDAYTLLSNLANKGVAVVLDMAERMPKQRFIIVRSPAEVTHGLPNFDERASALPNVEVMPRVTPDKVGAYLEQTRILLAPSRYETYGMSAIEAAQHGIPTVHVDTPHVREGIGDAAELIRPLHLDDTMTAVARIEADYTARSRLAHARAIYLACRQQLELEAWARFLDTL